MGQKRSNIWFYNKRERNKGEDEKTDIYVPFVVFHSVSNPFVLIQ